VQAWSRKKVTCCDLSGEQLTTGRRARRDKLVVSHLGDGVYGRTAEVVTVRPCTRTRRGRCR